MNAHLPTPAPLPMGTTSTGYPMPLATIKALDAALCEMGACEHHLCHLDEAGALGDSMPCPCGADVPMVDGAFADGSGLYCSEACLSAHGEAATETTDVWGRPIMQAGDGHSAWACNNRSCADHPASLYGSDHPAKAPSLLDIEPTPMRNPFASGAGLPMSVETKNSRYEVTLCALRMDEPAMAWVTCVRGTFEGRGWMVPTHTIVLSRDGFHVHGEVNLHTTAPTHVNDEPVSTWA